MQAFAGVSGEIYTNGYHELVANTLNAVGGLAASNNQPLIKIASALAVLIMSIKIIFNQNSRQIAGFEILKMGAFILGIQALFISAPDDDNHAYAVIDRITLQTTEVRQIPKGIGEFLSLFTTLEDGIMEKMELYFTTPNSLSYRQSGLGFTVSTQMEIMRTDIASNFLKKTFYDYFLNCKVDGDFSTSAQNLQSILSEEGIEIITSLGTDKTNLTLVYTDANPDGEVKSCKSAWNDIKNSLGTEAYNHQEAYAKARGLLSTTYASKIAMSNLITGSASATVTAREQLESAIARNATIDSIKKVAAFNGVSDSLLTKQLSISEISMTNSSILSNYQAQGTIPILKALCTAFIIVLSWIVGILAIATMNTQYIKFVIILNIWLMLWSPLFQVLNYAIDIMVDDALQLYGNGINANNQIGVYEILGGKLTIITNLVWFIPILAFGIAKGGEMAMTQFINGMIAPVQQAAHHTTKTDLQSAMGKSESYATSDGKIASFGAATIGEVPTGVGGQKTSMTSSGNSVQETASTGTTMVKSGLNQNVSAAVGKDGNISTHNDDASASVTNSSATALTNAENNVRSLQTSLGSENTNVVSQISNAGRSHTVTNTNGDAVKLNESTGETISNMSVAANKEAFGSTSKNALVESIKDNKEGRAALGISENSNSQIVGKIISNATGLSANLTAQGTVSISTGNGTSFELSKDSSYGKEFTENFSKSISNQMSNSKENTQAFADMVSAVNGESQSDANSTSRKISKAYSEQESASETYQSTKQMGTSQGDNLMNSAFQNYFEKNSERWGRANNEQKADFMVNKMVGWNQSMEGIKDRMDFIHDNSEKSELRNTINAKDNISKGKSELKSEVDNHVKGNVSYDSNSNTGTLNNINSAGEEIRNTNVRNEKIDADLKSNVKEPGVVAKNVKNSSEVKGKVIEGQKFVKQQEADESVMINAIDGVDTGVDKLKDAYKSISGKDDIVDPDIKTYAENNKAMNESAYDNAKVGDNNLIKNGWFKDDIIEDKLKGATDEQLARIYQHNKAENSLSEYSSKILKAELGIRQYVLNNNEFSSNYEGETVKADSIIKNGDSKNPASSIKNNNELNQSERNGFDKDFKYSY
jgi:conjugal transfer mating pair stabilization protein TraG